MPTMPQLQDFRDLFPELATYTDAQVNMWITQSDAFFDQDRWDDMLFLGVLYWVAHQLVISKTNAGQPILDDGVMKKVGDIAKTRDATLMLKAAEDPYYRTVYGQQYRSYRMLVGAGSVAV